MQRAPKERLGKSQGHEVVAPDVVAYIGTRGGKMAQTGPQEPPRPTISKLIRAPAGVRAQATGETTCMALLDDGAAANIIEDTLAIEWNLEVLPLTENPLKAANATPIDCTGHCIIPTYVVDSNGEKWTGRVPFFVMRNPVAPMILGMPWMEQANPKKDYYQKSWFKRKGRGPKWHKVAVEEPEEFIDTINSGSADLYTITVIEGGEPTQDPPLTEIPEPYRHLNRVFSEEEAAQLPQSGPYDLSIDTEEGTTPPYGPLYNLGEAELAYLREYLEEYLKKGWIRRSRSSAGAPIMFAKKKDGSLRLCVDYRGLNAITVKNRHPLPLIQESLDRLARAVVFSRFDVRNAYHRMRIKHGHEWKTAFRTRYGLFEYLVVPFGLTNAPAAFQEYINRALADSIDVICVVYLDDILVYSDSEEEHIQHVQLVLERLLEYGLYVKLSKCEFHITRTEFLGFVVSPNGVEADKERLRTIQEWPEPTSVRDVRVFMGFVNYYRRFVKGFSSLAAPLNKLTQKGTGSAIGGHAQRKEESVPLDIGQEGRAAFEKMKSMFTDVPIMAHYKPGRATRLETDASGEAICGILSQLHEENAGKGQYRPVAYYSRKLIAAERRYDTHDKELLAVVESVKEWKRYLQPLDAPFCLITDHHNLKWFMTTKTLSPRQVRWAEVLSGFHFAIEYRPGRMNPADGPSRRPDYMEGAGDTWDEDNQVLREHLQAQLSGETPQPMTDEHVRAAINAIVVNRDAELGQEEPEDVTEAQKRAEWIREVHDAPTGGHFGYTRTLEKVKRRHQWEGMSRDVQEYVKGCLYCQKAKATRHAPYGPLIPLEVPDGPWEDITMDFITDLPQSEMNGQTYDTILVVVDKFTKMVHYVPTHKDLTAKGLGELLHREVLRLHGTPRSIVSDRGPQFNAKYWETLCNQIQIRRRMSSAYHPQTDGQTERQNQTLEQYLRVFCNFEQDDWAIWLSTAEFAYNDSVHPATGLTPFQANTGRHPAGPKHPEMAQKGPQAAEAMDITGAMVQIHRLMKQKLEEVRQYQADYHSEGRKETVYEEGQQVLLSAKNIRTVRPKKKLENKYIGPYTVLKRIGQVSYKLDIPKSRQIHPVFHVSLLEPWNPKEGDPRQFAPERDNLIENEEDIYIVDRITERKQDEQGSWRYKVYWKGYPPEEATWEPALHISDAAMRQFKRNQAKLSQKGPEEGIEDHSDRDEPKQRQKKSGKQKRGRGRPPKKRE
jgi:transposase InsO family protein